MLRGDFFPWSSCLRGACSTTTNPQISAVFPPLRVNIYVYVCPYFTCTHTQTCIPASGTQARHGDLLRNVISKQPNTKRSNEEARYGKHMLDVKRRMHREEETLTDGQREVARDAWHHVMCLSWRAWGDEEEEGGKKDGWMFRVREERKWGGGTEGEKDKWSEGGMAVVYAADGSFLKSDGGCIANYSFLLTTSSISPRMGNMQRCKVTKHIYFTVQDFTGFGQHSESWRVLRQPIGYLHIQQPQSKR